jgi:hypothetical protein
VPDTCRVARLDPGFSPDLLILWIQHEKRRATFLHLANLMGMSKKVVVFCFLAMLLLVAHAATTANTTPTPVVVELFTSEGCSSCPPADALLTKLAQEHLIDGAEVLVLGEHVDYWDHLGWKDRFSSPVFTERQEAYAKRFRLASAYTPQMVVDGQFETTGSDAVSIEREVGVAARAGKTARVSLAWTGNVLHVSVDGAGDESSAVLLALTEDSLTTSVAGGENGGRILRHDGVVRELRHLGNTSHGAFEKAISISPKSGWNPAKLRFIVFVQRPANGQVVGAAQTKYRQEG